MTAKFLDRCRMKARDAWLDEMRSSRLRAPALFQLYMRFMRIDKAYHNALERETRTSQKSEEGKVK